MKGARGLGGQVPSGGTAASTAVFPPRPQLQAPPKPQLRAPDGSVPSRASTASSGWQCSLPDLNRNLPTAVLPTRPQPQAHDGSVPHRTSTALPTAVFPTGPQPRSRRQCSPPDLNCKLMMAVFPTGPQRQAPDGSVPLCQIECQLFWQMECQNLCQIDCLFGWSPEVQLLARMIVTLIPTCCYRKIRGGQITCSLSCYSML